MHASKVFIYKTRDFKQTIVLPLSWSSSETSMSCSRLWKVTVITDWRDHQLHKGLLLLIFSIEYNSESVSPVYRLRNVYGGYLSKGGRASYQNRAEPNNRICQDCFLNHIIYLIWGLCYASVMTDLNGLMNDQILVKWKLRISAHQFPKLISSSTEIRQHNKLMKVLSTEILFLLRNGHV